MLINSSIRKVERIDVRNERLIKQKSEGKVSEKIAVHHTCIIVTIRKVGRVDMKN